MSACDFELFAGARDACAFTIERWQQSSVVGGTTTSVTTLASWNAAEVPHHESFPSLPNPIVIPLAATFVAPATLDQESGRQAIERAVQSGPLRPFDIARTEIETPEALWVPFWRVPVTVDAFRLTFTDVKVGDDVSLPVPHGGSQSIEAAVMICARADFPYEPSASRTEGVYSGKAEGQR